MRAILDCIKRFFGMYDSCGVKYSPQYLASIQFDIPFWPFIDQAEFADAVCIKNAKNTDFLQEQFKFALPGEQNLFKYQPYMNATAIGNLAYLALHAPDEKIRDRCKTIICNYRNYLNGR